MDIKEFKENVILSLYGELDEKQETELTRLLSGDPKYINEYRSLVRVHFLAGQSEIEVDEELEIEARQRLAETLTSENILQQREYQVRKSVPGEFIQQLTEWLLPSGFEGWTKCAVSLAAGLLIGLFFIGGFNEPVFDSVPDLASLDENTSITDVKFVRASGSSNDVELSFSATRSYSFIDSIDNPEVQNLLAYSLIKENNPGERIRTVGLLKDSADLSRQEIRDALLTALVTDENPVVRGQALSALKEYRSDEAVQSTLINVLRYDENSKMRIEAINMLSESIIPGRQVPQGNIDAMKRQMEVEDNLYMKNQLNNILEKISLEHL